MKNTDQSKNPDVCPYCGHEIIDDDQEYCDFCGSDIEKEEVPNNEKGSSGSCFGIIGTAFFVLLLLFIVLVRQ